MREYYQDSGSFLVSWTLLCGFSWNLEGSEWGSATIYDWLLLWNEIKTLSTSMNEIYCKRLILTVEALKDKLKHQLKRLFFSHVLSSLLILEYKNISLNLHHGFEAMLRFIYRAMSCRHVSDVHVRYLNSMDTCNLLWNLLKCCHVISI